MINEGYQETFDKVKQGMLGNVSKLIKKYKNPDAIIYGKARKEAKKVQDMENTDKLKEAVKAALMNEKKKPFPDLTGDGKVTKADILKARGVKLDEEISAEKYPRSITVELTDKFIREKNLSKSNREIEMQPKIKYKLGNTVTKPDEEAEIYFAEYLPDIGEIAVNSYIIPAVGKKVGKTEWFLYLKDKNKLYPREVQDIQFFVDKGELKNVPDADCIFRKNESDGTKGFVVGAQDHRGYFEIVKINDPSFNQSTVSEDLDLGHEDDEPHMLKADLYKIGKYAMELYQMVDQFEGQGEVDFPAWWQSKITNAASMISSAKHYLEFELKEPEIDAMVGVAQNTGAIDNGISNIEEIKAKVLEKLTAKSSMKTYIDDFSKSKAPQFKGKSKEKKRQMAIAAKLSK